MLDQDGSATVQEDLETQLTRLWTQVLQVDGIGCRENFFDLGGDSFLAMRLVRLIDTQLGCRTTVTDVLARPTIAELAQFLKAEHA